MEIKQKAIEKFGDILIRLGEASIVGGVATFFVNDFPKVASLFALIGGIILIFTALYFINYSDKLGV